MVAGKVLRRARRSPLDRTARRLALVVVAHPDLDRSFAAAMSDAAVKGLGEAGFEVVVLDLYAIGFEAAMSRAERLAYATDQPILDPLVQTHAELVGRAQALVFVYPTWWWGMPAIMKGWLERVMVAGVAFKLHPRTGRFRPGLDHVRRIAGISTYGTSRLGSLFYNDAGRRTLRRGLRMSAPRARTSWFALHDVDVDVEACDPAQRAAFLHKIEKTMGTW